jgi:hypothetical protein
MLWLVVVNARPRPVRPRLVRLRLVRLRPGLEDHVERGLGGPTDAAEPGLVEQVAQVVNGVEQTRQVVAVAGEVVGCRDLEDGDHLRESIAAVVGQCGPTWSLDGSDAVCAPELR